MTDIEFKSFSKIKHYSPIQMRITQKMDGTNGQIYINGTDILVGSRNRWLSVEDDNHGFCKHVMDNKEAFLGLGPGRHYGEWCGPRINSGEGLSEHRFYLFSPSERYLESTLPPGVEFIPLLYEGLYGRKVIQNWFDFLKDNGSVAVPGFMGVEGIVVEILNTRFKYVSHREDVRQYRPKKEEPVIDKEHYLQPDRLKKLISRDEKYIREFPSNIGIIIKDYLDDVQFELMIDASPEEIEQIRKKLSKPMYGFVKDMMKEIME